MGLYVPLHYLEIHHCYRDAVPELKIETTRTFTHCTSSLDIKTSNMK